MPMLRKPQKPMRSLLGLALSPVTGTLTYGASAIAGIAKSIGTKVLEAIDSEETMTIPGRFSGIPSTRELLMLMLLGTGSGIVADLGMPDPRPLPQYAVTSVMEDDPLPEPDDDIEMIFWKLPTPQRFGKFLKKHVTYDSTKNPITTFHISPQEFQDGGFRGVCNNMARKYCECMERHGHPSYYANLIPQNVLETRPSTSHQIAFIRTDEDTIWICDNLEVFPWRGSIESYVSEKHSGMRFAPWGIARYQRPKENPLSRAMVQFHWPEEIRMCPLPPSAPIKEVMIAIN